MDCPWSRDLGCDNSSLLTLVPFEVGKPPFDLHYAFFQESIIAVGMVEG